MQNLTTLLIANRGEIALRIMHTARKLGLGTVAVYSEADVDAPHRHFADVSVPIGGAAAADSYLRIDAIIEAALRNGADAIHPGYGLLSENAAFARAVNDAGLIFVGPPADAMAVMADKARAKARMHAAGVPCVPGYDGAEQTAARFAAEAQHIGVPLMLKAAAGGGGRGMRLVTSLTELPRAFEAARTEAQAAFGDGTLLLERAVGNAKHIEIQVFADTHGHVIHLGERDCSVQRRHQKVIEEAPGPTVSDALGESMGEAAVAAARAVDYVGAGTVEFLLDESGQFYFLEMNTRLQVEHPVTELITGLDLVEWQLRVADGEPLPLGQSEVRSRGHAIEVRLCAEAPSRDFLPDTGHVAVWRTPQEAVAFDVSKALVNGVRIDAGIASDGEVSPHYDSMVAKIIAHGANREQARRRLVRALRETRLLGPECNRDFLLDMLVHPRFVDGSFTTGFISEHFANYEVSEPESGEFALAAAVMWHLLQRRALARSVAVNPELLGWASTGALFSTFDYGTAQAPLPVEVRSLADGVLEVSAQEVQHEVVVMDLTEHQVTAIVDGVRNDVSFDYDGIETLMLASAVRTFTVRDIARSDKAAADAHAGGQVRAPMHGRVLEVCVAPGQHVNSGTRIAVLEAMKMQHEIVADIDGAIESIMVETGVQIAAGEVMVLITAQDPQT